MTKSAMTNQCSIPNAPVARGFDSSPLRDSKSVPSRHSGLVIHWALAIASLVALRVLPSHAAERELALPSAWPAGTVMRYELVREKENVRAGVTNFSRVRTPLTIEVLERTKAGYRLAWTTGRSTVEEPKQLDESQKRLLNIADGLKLVVRTDASGSPEELLNRVEVAASYQKVLGEIRANLAAGGLAADKIAQATAPVEALTQPERVPALALKEPNIFFLMTGGSFVPGQPRDYDDELPNPLTGRPITTRARMWLKEVRREAGEAVLDWTQTPKAPDASLKLSDRATHTLDLRTGWPKSVRFERVVEAGNSRRVERVEFNTPKP